MSDVRTDPPAARVLSMVVVNDRRELARIGERVDRFGGECGLSDDDLARVHLALDELVSNVIKYGYDDSGEHQIRITVAVDGEHLTISVEDDGKPFNPIEAPAPDLDLPIEDRPIGGLGLFLVKSIAGTLEYRREGGHNIVTLEMPITQATPGTGADTHGQRANEDS